MVITLFIERFEIAFYTPPPLSPLCKEGEFSEWFFPEVRQ